MNGTRFWAATGLAMLAAAMPALAQKSGGILKLSHFDSPASMSILEESTRAAEQPMMGVFNNLVMYDQHVAQNSLDTVVPDLATELVVERGRHGADLPVAPGRQMARRQAVHRRRRQMHLGPADGDRQRQAARQSAQVLVRATSQR